MTRITSCIKTLLISLSLCSLTASAGIHFLAIDVPPETSRDVVRRIQPEIQKAIEEKAGKEAGKISYHTAENIHISLIRFDDIPNDMLNEYINVFNRYKNKLPDKDIADKVGKAHLEVTKTGYIVFTFDEPVTMTGFVKGMMHELYNHDLPYSGSDFSLKKPYPHFSIARFDPKKADLDAIRKVIGTLKLHPACPPFRPQEFFLKQSMEPEKHLTYMNVETFKRDKKH